jgi:hypothetical protein
VDDSSRGQKVEAATWARKFGLRADEGTDDLREA